MKTKHGSLALTSGFSLQRQQTELLRRLLRGCARLLCFWLAATVASLSVGWASPSAQVDVIARPVNPQPVTLSPAQLQLLLQDGQGLTVTNTLQVDPQQLTGWLLESPDHLNLHPVVFNTTTVALPAGALLSYRHEQPLEEVSPAGQRLLRLPFDLRTAISSSRVEPLGLPEILPARESLRWRPSLGSFTLDLLLVLRTDGPARPLSNPVTFVLRSNAQKVQPAQIVVRSTNQVIGFTIQDPGLIERATLEVEILGLIGVSSTPVADFALERPKLALSLDTQRLPGLGLGQAVLRVEAQGLLEAPASTPAGPVAAPLPRLRASAKRGRLSPSELPLDGAGRASASLRSIGLGDEVLLLEGLPFAATELTLYYHFPWLFLLAALLGGLAGGVAAVHLLLRHSLNLRDLALGMITAVVAAVAYTSGINLLGVDLGSGTHEALIFTLAALTALVGLPGLNKLFPAAKSPPVSPATGPGS
jgi:hypothetical protein